MVNVGMAGYSFFKRGVGKSVIALGLVAASSALCSMAVAKPAPKPPTVKLPGGSVPRVHAEITRLSIVAAKPGASAAQLGELTRLPISVTVSNPGKTAQTMSLKAHGDFAGSIITQAEPIAAKSRKTFNLVLEVDLRGKQSTPQPDLSYAVDLTVGESRVDTKKFTIRTQTPATRPGGARVRAGSPAEGAKAEFDVGFRAGRLNKLFTTAHLRKKKRRVTGAELEMYIENTGTSAWQAPIELEVTTKIIKSDGRSSGRSFTQTATLAEAVTPGEGKVWTIQLGTKRPKFTALIVGGPDRPKPPGMGTLAVPLLRYDDAWPIRRGDRFQVNVVMSSPHDTELGNNQLVLTGILQSDLDVARERSEVAAAPTGGSATARPRHEHRAREGK